MLKKYAIWNKKDDIFAATGVVYTAKEWIEMHPIAKKDSVTVLCGAGELNGILFETLGNLVRKYEQLGCDFSACVTDEEKLEAVETFEARRKVMMAEANANAVMNEELTATSLASIAASLEYQNMMTLDDVEV